MITVIILWDNEIEKLEKTLESLPKRGGTAIRVSVWNPAGTSMPETLLKKYPDVFQDVSTTIAFGAVTVLRAGEYYSDPGMPEKLTRRLEEEKDCSGAIPAVCVPGKPLPKRGSMPGNSLILAGSKASASASSRYARCHIAHGRFAGQNSASGR